MQDKQSQKDPLKIRFSRVYTDSCEPDFRYVEFHICRYQEGAYLQSSIVSYQNKNMVFRQTESDPSKLECMIEKSGPYVSGQSQFFVSCSEKSW